MKIDKKDYIIKDPSPFIAEDGSYHGDMEGVRMANEIFFNQMKVLKTNNNNNNNLDILLIDELLNHKAVVIEEEKGKKR